MLFDAIAIAGGTAAADALAADMKAREHVRDAWMHGKALLFAGEARRVWEAVGVPHPVDNDPAVVTCDQADGAALDAFALAISGHRNFTRETLAQPV